jgi:hypothetical protein
MTVETASTVNAEALVKSFERHLRAENKRPQTIDHYIGASRQFLAFAATLGANLDLGRTGLPFQASRRAATAE